TITLVFFSAASMMVVIPSTIQVFAWTVTVALGRPEFRAPLMFIGGFIVFFVLGGLSGIMFAAIPFDQATTDTYFVVAHFPFILTAGLLLIFWNLVYSRFRGAPAGPDPFFGGTLEWATTSPPPPYNFPVIPTVTSAYPNWDVEDRRADAARLDRGELVLDQGH